MDHNFGVQQGKRTCQDYVYIVSYFMTTSIYGKVSLMSLDQRQEHSIEFWKKAARVKDLYSQQKENGVSDVKQIS